MEENDDFGFTRRDDKLLRKVRTSRTTVGKEEVGEVKSRRAPCYEEAGLKNTLDQNDGFIPVLTKGVVKGGATSTETGSDPLNKQHRIKISVDRDTPNIPNVVEYHLKVKSHTQENLVSNNHVSVNIYDTHITHLLDLIITCLYLEFIYFPSTPFNHIFRISL